MGGVEIVAEGQGEVTGVIEFVDVDATQGIVGGGFHTAGVEYVVELQFQVPSVVGEGFVEPEITLPGGADVHIIGVSSCPGRKVEIQPDVKWQPQGVVEPEYPHRLVKPEGLADVVEFEILGLDARKQGGVPATEKCRGIVEISPEGVELRHVHHPEQYDIAPLSVACGLPYEVVSD